MPQIKHCTSIFTTKQNIKQWLSHRVQRDTPVNENIWHKNTDVCVFFGHMCDKPLSRMHAHLYLTNLQHKIYIWAIPNGTKKKCIKQIKVSSEIKFSHKSINHRKMFLMFRLFNQRQLNKNLYICSILIGS